MNACSIMNATYLPCFLSVTLSVLDIRANSNCIGMQRYIISREPMQCVNRPHPLVYRGRVADKGGSLLAIPQPANLGNRLNPGPDHRWGIMGLGCNSMISSFLAEK